MSQKPITLGVFHNNVFIRYAEDTNDWRFEIAGIQSHAQSLQLAKHAINEIRTERYDSKLRESIDHIKRTIQLYPGVTLGVPRQSGKTAAIMELLLAHRDFAFYLAHCDTAAEHAKSRFHRLYGYDLMPVPRFITRPGQALGYSWPVYVDEYWLLSAGARLDLDDMGTQVVCRLGTP